MSFLQNIFGKKTKQKESATSDLPKQLESKSIQETHTVVNAATEVSQPVNKAEEDKRAKPDTASPAEPDAKSHKKLEPKPDSTTKTPSAPWRTFPIFVSSTYAEMQVERDYLKNVVFQLFEEGLQKRRIKLEIVDLRWGVNTTFS